MNTSSVRSRTRNCSRSSVSAAPVWMPLRKMGRSRCLTAATLPAKSTGSICEYSDVILRLRLTRGRGPQAAWSITATAGQEAASAARPSSRSR